MCVCVCVCVCYIYIYIYIFHEKLDYLLHVLYDIYNACVVNLTDKLTLPLIGHPSCNKIKRLIKSICITNKCLFDFKFVFVKISLLI